MISPHSPCDHSGGGAVIRCHGASGSERCAAMGEAAEPAGEEENSSYRADGVSKRDMTLRCAAAAARLTSQPPAALGALPLL